MLCVSDTDAVREVVFGKDGVADGGGAGKILVDLSSIPPGMRPWRWPGSSRGGVPWPGSTARYQVAWWGARTARW